MEHVLNQSLFRAECLESKRPFQNLYELDLSLWYFFQSCGSANKYLTAQHLSLSEDTVAELSRASIDKIAKLASGVFLSFSLNAETSTLLKNIASVLQKYNERLPDLLLENSRSIQKLEVIKTEKYWRVMRDLAAFNGVKRAALAFNVDYEVVESVSKLSDAQILNLALQGWINFSLRFDESTLIDLLTSEHITHHTLVRYQQILSRNEKSVLPKKNVFEKPSRPSIRESGLEEQPKPGSIKSHAPLWIKAKHLTAIGFITRVVTIETGVTQKQMVRLKKEFLDEGHELPASATKLRNGCLIRDYTSSIQASILMLSYYKYGGDDVKRNINIDALGSALMLYHKIRNEAEMNEYRWKPIDSNSGYSLARELRGSGESSQAYFEECPCCKITIFTSTNQSVLPEDRCPFCRISEARKIKAV